MLPSVPSLRAYKCRESTAIGETWWSIHTNRTSWHAHTAPVGTCTSWSSWASSVLLRKLLRLTWKSGCWHQREEKREREDNIRDSQRMEQQHTNWSSPLISSSPDSWLHLMRVFLVLVEISRTYQIEQRLSSMLHAHAFTAFREHLVFCGWVHSLSSLSLALGAVSNTSSRNSGTKSPWREIGRRTFDQLLALQDPVISVRVDQWHRHALVTGLIVFSALRYLEDWGYRG